MNSSYHDVLNTLSQSKPPASRLWSVILDLLPLIPGSAFNDAKQVLIKHSQVRTQVYIQMCFLSLHVFLTFEDRLSCMHTSHTWRSAVLQPSCWPTFFGTQPQISVVRQYSLCSETTTFVIPISRPFCQQMSQSWSRIKSLVIQLDNSLCVRNLLHWLTHTATLTVESLQASDRSEHVPRADSIQLLSIVCHRFTSSLRILDLNSIVWQLYFDASSALQQLQWPVLETLTAYGPFQRCFIDAPQLKRLILTTSKSDPPDLNPIFLSRQPALLYPHCHEIECRPLVHARKSKLALPSNVRLLKIHEDVYAALSMLVSTLDSPSNHQPLELIMCRDSFAINLARDLQHMLNYHNIIAHFGSWNIVYLSWDLAYFKSYYRSKLKDHYNILNELFSWSLTKKFPAIRFISTPECRNIHFNTNQDIREEINWLKQQGHDVQIVYRKSNLTEDDLL